MRLKDKKVEKVSLVVVWARDLALHLASDASGFVFLAFPAPWCNGWVVRCMHRCPRSGGHLFLGLVRVHKSLWTSRKGKMFPKFHFSLAFKNLPYKVATEHSKKEIKLFDHWLWATHGALAEILAQMVQNLSIKAKCLGSNTIRSWPYFGSGTPRWP